MSSFNITYQKLKNKLATLGFIEKRVPGSHIVMEHQPSDTLLLLPLLKRNSPVTSSQLAGIKRQVVMRGLIADAEFNRIMSPVNGSSTRVMPLQHQRKIKPSKVKVKAS